MHDLFPKIEYALPAGDMVDNPALEVMPNTAEMH
jgi:hypothetical protein